MIRAYHTTLVAAFAVTASCQSAPKPPIITPEAAVASARISWESVYDKTHYPVYSKAETANLEPYTATLKEGVWTVRGTIPPGYRGYTLVTTVRVSDGTGKVDAIEVNQPTGGESLIAP
jgi:hypothetical protein